MTPRGYGGHILKINLTTSEIQKESLDREFAAKYIGGWGFCTKLMYDHMPVGKDALDPLSPIIIAPGLLNGTLSPGASKVFMMSKCPASNTISPWVGSLHFGTKLKWAGYDAVVIIGKAPKPVYLRITDDDVEICDAGDLWGKKDLDETTTILKERHGKGHSIAAIGPAGENLVKISIMLMDSGTTCGRTMGCTMGSKNLKAIAVEGTKGIKLADTKRFMSIVDRLVEKAMRDPIRNKWKDQALYFIWPLWDQAGYLTTKNYTETYPQKFTQGAYSTEEYMKRKVSLYGCPSCLAPDKHVVEIKEGELKGLRGAFSTNIDPALGFGCRLAVGGLNNALELGAMGNAKGIDYLTFPAIVGWMIELYERGILTKEDTGGVELKEGYEMAKMLLEQTIRREGLGAIIAEGFIRAAKIIGKGAEKYAPTIKGTEPDFDGRASLGLEVFTSAVNVRPCRDLPVGGVTVAKGRKPEFFQKVIPKAGYVSKEKAEQVLTAEGFDLPRLTVHYEKWASILDLTGICFRMQNSSLYTVETCAELYTAATGIEKTPEELLEDGERACNLSKFLNAREGFSRKDDRFPDRWFEPLKRPDLDQELILKDYFDRKQVSREDVEQMLNDYYDEHGWDVETGIPTKEKLIELGLKDAAEEIEKIKVT